MQETVINTTIIIVTYNGSKWINRCLGSCENEDVIVVDNSSTDNTVQLIEVNYPNVIILKQDVNLGFGAANNLGISYALNNGADAVFLMNQDVYLFPNTINSLKEIYLQNNEYGILSPVHLNVDESRLDAAFSDYLNYNSNNYFVGDLYNNRRQEIYEVSFVNAAGWFISKEALLSVGGFDPIFFHYGEDNNLCQRMLYHNYKIGVVTDSKMIHDRENHANNKRDKSFFSSFYLKKQENILKNIFGNPFNKVESFSYREIRSMQASKLFKFQFRDFIKTFKLSRLKVRWFKESIESRKITRKKGSHYLIID